MATRDELVEAGVDLLESGGLAHLTLREIARTAGVSHGAPRHHFPTYESLVAAIARRGVEDLDVELAPILRDPDPVRAIRGAAQRYVSFAAERPDMFELIGRQGPAGRRWGPSAFGRRRVVPRAGRTDPRAKP
ncbi:TetR/AcrR family transcriptional regulator [Mumia zhuanghuii]|uniref:TetR/AcrR family transcriptional regulator n=1 Tax=Mumia zhuanghuii TaxID=2585211 RepID=UPI00363C06AA